MCAHLCYLSLSINVMQQRVFTIGHFLFMSEPAPTLSSASRLPLYPLSDVNLHVCSTSQDSHRGGWAREGGKGDEKEGMRREKGAGVGKSTGKQGERGRDKKKGHSSKCDLSSSPGWLLLLWQSSFILHTSINPWLCFLLIHLTSPPSFFYTVNQLFGLKAFSFSLHSSSSSPHFISHVGFLSALWCESSLLLLHSNSPPQSPKHHNNLWFKYCYSLSDTDPFSTKLLSRVSTVLPEHLTSSSG